MLGARHRRLIQHLHSLGPVALAAFLAEVRDGESIDSLLEDYGDLDPSLVRALGGDKFPAYLRPVR